MFKNKRTKTIISILCMSLMLSLTGCDLMPTLHLTESESRVIAEYAAGLLLKYDKNYEGNLHKIEEEEAVEMVHEHAPISEEAEPEGSVTSWDDSGSSDKKDKPSMEYANISIAEALGLDGFDVTYSNMETAQIYPEEEGEVLFSMQAQQGMEFLVLHFNVTNNSENDNVCDVLKKSALFRIIIDGDERVASQRTILLNDFSQYHDTIAGYGMVDTVLVFELGAGTAEGIDSLDLVINCNKTNSIYKIK